MQKIKTREMRRRWEDDERKRIKGYWGKIEEEEEMRRQKGREDERREEKSVCCFCCA